MASGQQIDVRDGWHWIRPGVRAVWYATNSQEPGFAWLGTWLGVQKIALIVLGTPLALFLVLLGAAVAVIGAAD